MGRPDVDLRRRTITGLVLPWGVPGVVLGKRARFAPRSLRPVSRNWLLFDHDNSTRVGLLAAAWADQAGQWATYRVRRGAAGDRALAVAKGMGLSAGMDPASVVLAPDPREPWGHQVLRAVWGETSLTRNPRFEDAKVTEVCP